MEGLVAALWLAQAAPEAPPPEAPAPVAVAVTPASRLGLHGALAIQCAVPRGGIVGRPQGAPVQLHLRQEDLIGLALEIEGQAGVDIGRRWFVGAYGTVGGGVPGHRLQDGCGAFGTTCSARTSRAGLLARFDFWPGAARNLWVALGVGAQRHRAQLAARRMEYDAPDAPVALVKSELVLRGAEVRLMAGVDTRLRHRSAIGLFGAVSVGEYGDVTYDGRPLRGTSPTATWLTLGARGVLFP